MSEKATTTQRVEIVESNGLHGYSLVFEGYLVPFVAPYRSLQEPGKWHLDLLPDGTGRDGHFSLPPYSLEELEQQLPLALNLMAVSHGLNCFGDQSQQPTHAFNRKIMVYPYQTLEVAGVS